MVELVLNQWETEVLISQKYIPLLDSDSDSNK